MKKQQEVDQPLNTVEAEQRAKVSTRLKGIVESSSYLR